MSAEPLVVRPTFQLGATLKWSLLSGAILAGPIFVLIMLPFLWVPIEPDSLTTFLYFGFSTAWILGSAASVFATRFRRERQVWTLHPDRFERRDFWGAAAAVALDDIEEVRVEDWEPEAPKRFGTLVMVLESEDDWDEIRLFDVDKPSETAAQLAERLKLSVLKPKTIWVHEWEH